MIINWMLYKNRLMPSLHPVRTVFKYYLPYFHSHFHSHCLRAIGSFTNKNTSCGQYRVVGNLDKILQKLTTAPSTAIPHTLPTNFLSTIPSPITLTCVYRFGPLLSENVTNVSAYLLQAVSSYRYIGSQLPGMFTAVHILVPARPCTNSIMR